jgi:hypothetical protein
VRTRLGLGPVFAYKWLTTTRRWQLYALRVGFVCAILAGMVFIWQIDQGNRAAGSTTSLRNREKINRAIFCARLEQARDRGRSIAQVIFSPRLSELARYGQNLF